MAYSDDLLEQAVVLATVDPRRPRQASLRRAISSAYYAVFHEVVDRAVSSVLSGSDAGGPIGGRLCRVVHHAAIVKAAKWFGSTPGDMPLAIRSMRAGSPTIDPRFSSLCRSIADLQAERHRADYDHSLAFSRGDTRRLVAVAERVVSDLRALDIEGDAQIFLLGCLFGEGLTKNA